MRSARRTPDRHRVAAVAVTVALALVAGCARPGGGNGDEHPTFLVSSCPLDAAATSAADTRIGEALLSQYDLATRDDFRNLRATVVSLCGTTVHEEYFGTGPDVARDVGGITTSVVSTLVGIALADGSITGLDARLADLLPAYARRMSGPVASVTLAELMTMTSGIVADPLTGRPGAWVRAADPVGEILRLGITGREGEFAYSSASAHLLSAVLARATGMSAAEFARTRLFDPLGIGPGRAWPADRNGVSLGYSGLALTPRDLVLFGRLYLGGGAWRGRQVVPGDWVGAAVEPRVPLRGADGADHYGYGWWVSEFGARNGFTARGYGGQLVDVIPDQSLVAVFATDVDPRDPLGARMSPEQYQTLVSFAILPVLRAPAPTP